MLAVNIFLFLGGIFLVIANGFFWANPLLKKIKTSLRVRNQETTRIKVNDLAGNPIEIAAVVVCKGHRVQAVTSRLCAGDRQRNAEAAAVVSARFKIVEGAVGMVEHALAELKNKGLVELDEDRKAAMVSNLLVVLCSESSATPVVNTGTLYQ